MMHFQSVHEQALLMHLQLSWCTQVQLRLCNAVSDACSLAIKCQDKLQKNMSLCLACPETVYALTGIVQTLWS